VRTGARWTCWPCATLYGTRDANIADNVYQLGARESSAANTLVDDGGHDTIDASALDSGVSLDLVPGHLGSAGITTAGFAGVENLGIVATSWIEDAIGTAFDDVLIGNDLANTLTGGLGNDWIDGGAGADRAVFAGRRSDYLLSNAFGKLYVEARDGVGGFDTVSGIETLVFIDQALALAIGALGADGEYSVDEDRSLTANLPDPSDVARASASYSLVGQPLHGLAQVSADGQLSYTPAANFNGSDQIVFALTSAGSTNVYQAFVSIRPVNDGPPLARDVTLLAAAGSTLRSSLPQATDVDQDPISYAATAAAKNGVVVVASDGSFSYTAKAGFSGNDSFNFIVGDGRGGTNTYTAAVQVLPVSNTREGTENGDQLLGSPTADALFGYAGNDRLTGAAGDDLIDGGAGIDTSVLAAARARFQLTRTEFGWTLQDNSGTDGNDSITGIERTQAAWNSSGLPTRGSSSLRSDAASEPFGHAPQRRHVGHLHRVAGHVDEALAGQAAHHARQRLGRDRQLRRDVALALGDPDDAARSPSGDRWQRSTSHCAKRAGAALCISAMRVDRQRVHLAGQAGDQPAGQFGAAVEQVALQVVARQFHHHQRCHGQGVDGVLPLIQAALWSSQPGPRTGRSTWKLPPSAPVAQR
jgi:Ca2+-binding RTX toxin-like protein